MTAVFLYETLVKTDQTAAAYPLTQKQESGFLLNNDLA
jgi:hypothetical protein